MKLIVANWKLNPTSLNDAVSLVLGLGHLMKVGDYEKVVILPPFIFLEELVKRFKHFNWGAQDVFWKKNGAYTGEVSLPMLKSVGINWVLVGHSERRLIFGETDEDINKKMNAALEAGFNVIVAVGELQKDDHISEVIKSFKKSLIGADKNKLDKLIVAYEPVWAISTTPNAKPDNPARSNQIIGELKHIAFKIFGESSKKIRFLYGGSVNAENASKFLSQAYIDGALVGGTSLKVEEFFSIINRS